MDMVKNLRFDDFVPIIEINEKTLVERVVQGFDNLIRSEIKFKPAVEIFNLNVEKDRELAARIGVNPLLKTNTRMANEEDHPRVKFPIDPGERSKSAKVGKNSNKMAPPTRNKLGDEGWKSGTSRDESLRANSGKVYETKRISDDDAPENLSLNKLPSFVSHQDKDGPENTGVHTDNNSRRASVKDSSNRAIKPRVSVSSVGPSPSHASKVAACPQSGQKAGSAKTTSSSHRFFPRHAQDPGPPV
jgi:hypothetical protein